MRLRHTRRYGIRGAVAVATVIALGLSTAGGPVNAQRDGPKKKTVRLAVKRFADPGVMKLGNRYYAYATGPGFRVSTSKSPAKGWSKPKKGMPKRFYPRWNSAGGRFGRHMWAPTVFRNANGRYVMYFTAWNKHRHATCIGIATAKRPTGPFKDSGRPRICAPKGFTEAIDPSTYLAGNRRRYIVWKASNPRNGVYQIRARRVIRQGTKLTGRTKVLMSTHGDVMEAPQAFAHSGRVWMFLSRGGFKGCDYRTEVWSSPTFWGNHFKRRKTILTSKSTSRRLCGPGGAHVTRDGRKRTRIFFHAYPRAGRSEGPRHMYTGVLRWGKKGLNPHVL